MSYRDLRNFTEIMKTLGYNRLISMENFRTPNFPLVAEILIWIVGRFDPDSNDIHTSYDTQEDRVRLIRSTAQLLALKGNIMLNTKRLYQADGFAVKELLKVVTKLYEAVQLLEEDVGRAQPLNSRLRGQAKQWSDISSRIQELKMSRELASQVVTKGALLYELLGKEVELREARNWGVTVQLELGNMEGGVKGAIVSTRHNIANVASLIENVAATEAALDLKIEKKKTELERNQKRLLTLMKVRPAFLEEYEKLELELQSLYQEYITRVRCHAYLEQVQEEAAQLEHEKMLQIQRETRKLMEELQSEDAQRLMLEDGDDEEGGEHEGHGTQQHTRRLRTATASRARLMTGKKRVVGGMDPGQGEEEEDLVSADDSNSLAEAGRHLASSSSSSDSSLLIDEYDGELNSEELTAPHPPASDLRTPHTPLEDDDDDF